MSKSRSSKNAYKPQRVPMQKQVNELREQMEILRKQFQQVNFKLAQDFQVFEQKDMTLWEYLWATIEALRMEGNLEFLTEDRLEHFREIVMTRWRAEALEGLKKKLTPGQAVCQKCHHVDGGPNFFDGEDEESTCNNCNAKGTAFVKDTVVVQAEKAS